MNKLVKGSIAGAAGIALLLGGLGSFALWSDSVVVGSETVSSGELKIEKDAVTAPATNGVWSPDLDLIVPGDELTYTEAFTVTASGDNLHATLTDNMSSIVEGIDGATTSADYTVSTQSAGATSTLTPSAGVYSFDEGTYSVDVTITVVFDDQTSGTTGQNSTLELDDIEIFLNQITLPPVAV